MKIPPANSHRFKVLSLIYRDGPMTREDASSKLATLSVKSVTAAFSALMEDRLMTREGYVYSLRPETEAQLADMAEVRERYVGEVAAPRVINVYASKPYIPTRPLIRQEAEFWSNVRSRHV